MAYRPKFSCFSLPVMLATFTIEIALIAITLWRYKLTPATRLIALILALLAAFQLAEFSVCTANGAAATWSRFGFLAITLLPILSLHLTHVITKKFQWAVKLGYLTAAPWMILFLLPQAFLNHACSGNYVIFRLGAQYNLPYLWYYFAWLGIGLLFCLYSALATTNDAKRRALHGLAAGYLVFALPTFVVNILDPATIYAIPSIMCGFAVLYALILAFVVAPTTQKFMHK